MDLPEPPLLDLPTASSFTCPRCNRKVGTWVVTEAFRCPNCGKSLISNKRQALNRGLMVGLAVYTVLALLLYVLGRTLPAVGMLIHAAGAVVAFYAGYLAYRRAVVISKGAD